MFPANLALTICGLMMQHVQLSNVADAIGDSFGSKNKVCNEL